MNSDHSPFKVAAAAINKEIEVPSSKSYANRLLVLAAISKEDVFVENLPLSTDVTLMIECLQLIGLNIEQNSEGVWIRGSFPECEREGPHLLNTGDGGTTNRFLCGLVARGKEKYTLKASGHMLNRPMLPLLSALNSLSVKTTYRENNEWISIQGPIIDTESVEVDANDTTQFITSVALSLADKAIEVKAKNLEVSLPYWHLSQELIRKFKENNLSFYNPIDFSSLTYPLALAAVTGEVLVKNCKEIDDNQADSAFIEIMRKVGAKVQLCSIGLSIEKDKLIPIIFDGSQCPDAVPSILFVCAFCEGQSQITNLEVLTHKECDRFLEMIRMLKAFKVDIEVDYDKYSITINGPTHHREVIDYDPPADHRMVMVAYLFQRVLNGGVLTNTQHVKKSFANFFEVIAV